MNTARRLMNRHQEKAAGNRSAYDGQLDFKRQTSHLRLVVDNTAPRQIPVFELPAWFDHLGNAMWYSALGLVIINVVNQIVLW